MIHSIQSLKPTFNQPIQPNTVLAGILILAGGLSTRMGTPKALLELPNGETLLDYHVKHASKFGVPIFIADNQQGFTPSNAVIDSSDLAIEVINIADYQPNCDDNDNDLNIDDAAKVVSGSIPSNQLKLNQSKPKHSVGPLGAIMAGMRHSLACSYNPCSKNHRHLKESSFDTMDTSTNVDNVNLNPHKSSDNWLMVISCDSLVTATDIWSQLSVINYNQLHLKVYCLQDNEGVYPLLGMYHLSLADELQRYLDNGGRRVMRFIDPYSQPINMPQAWYGLSNLNTPESFKQACQRMSMLD